MCGICGVINSKNIKVKQPILEKMNNALSHRGPDDKGLMIAKNIGLAHRRLSILDLSSAGHQPMFYDGGNLAIVFNGEIYNYLEIRQELQKSGFKFKSQTDTEVILASYKKWGIEALKKFNGMWAFAIYDKKKNLIFASRDRLGVKPFYYLFEKEKFLFASEIKGILAHPEVKALPNKKIIWDYLVTGFLDHSEATFFQGVKELRGGHYLILNKGKLEIKKYWDLKKEELEISDKGAIEKFQSLFFDAVRLRLRSDVPIGTCLSGGLDSSAIVCVINQFLKKEKITEVGQWQKTFSAVYGQNFPKVDEEMFIREVIRQTKAKSYLVTPSPSKLQKEIKDLIYYQEQPFSTTSIYAQWNVFRLAAAKKIKVMLDGQGADELLAGYTGYFGLYFIDLLKRKKIGLFIKELYLFARNHRPVWSILKDIFVRGLKAAWLGDFTTRLFQRLNPAYRAFRPEFLHEFKSAPRIMFSRSYFRNALYNSLVMNLSSLLRYEDRNSMAFAIESRVPFLDYRLVEFIFSLASSDKIRNGQTKWIMREALKGVLPEKISTRQDKIGFATPEENWLRNDLKDELLGCFSSKSFGERGYFNQEKINQLYARFLNNKFQDSQLFWRSYCLEMWFQVFID